MTPICIDCWFNQTAKVVEGQVTMPAPRMARTYLPCDQCGTPTKFRKKDQ